MPPDGLLEVGRLGRPHGVRGDLFVQLTTDRVERVAAGSRLWADGRWLAVGSSNRSGARWRVHLDGVESREAAQALTGVPLYAEPIDDPGVLWVHDLIGATVVEVDGTERGVCVAVVDNPAADLLELASGALVPMTFVVSIDPPRVTIDPPPGLFELT